MKSGDRVTFLGCSKTQIEWVNGDDPNLVLEESTTYMVEYLEIYSYYTKIKLVGYDGWFNSVCFIKND